MTSCRDLEKYLTRDLEPPRREAFEAHARRCAGCRAEIERWGAVTAAVAGGARARIEPVTLAARDALIERARVEGPALDDRPAPRPGFLAWILVPAAAAVVLALAIGFAWVVGSDPGERPTRTGAGTSPAPSRVISSPAGSVVRAALGRARVVLAPGSEIEITSEDPARAGLFLDHGRVALDIEHLASGESLTVVAAGLEARVVGTVFAVSNRSGRVAVDVVEGVVAVTFGDGPSVDVEAGRRLVATAGVAPRVEDLSDGDRAAVIALLAEGEDAPAEVGDEGDLARDAGAGGAGGDLAASAASDRGRERSGIDASLAATGGEPIDAWRSLVAGGRFIEAEGELTAHLGSHPEDAAAWSLLADCRRKSGRWSDAVAAYLEVIDRASRSDADLARYKAGVILQDRLGDHVAAARLFGEYLDGSGGGALAPDAVLRRARSLVALGRRGEARELLERIVAEHPDLAAAESARRMLAEQTGAGEGPEGFMQPTQ